MKSKEDAPLRISQTILKVINSDDGVKCPKRFLEIYINKSVRGPGSEAMRKGMYFEKLCTGYEPKTFESPAVNKNGSPKADTLRIMEQAEVFRKKVDEYGIEIVDIGTKLTGEWPDGNTIVGIEDIYAKIHPNTKMYEKISKSINLEEINPNNDPIPVVIDLKLTADINRSMGYLVGSWAEPIELDHSQAYTSHLLRRNADNLHDRPGLPLFIYWVFDYSLNMGRVMYAKKIRPIDMAQLNESIRRAIERINAYKGMEDPYVPSVVNCSDCPLRETCERVINKDSLVVI